MVRQSGFLLAVLGVLIITGLAVSKSTTPISNRVEISEPSGALSTAPLSEKLSLAFLSDLHVDHSLESIAKLEVLISDVVSAEPDLVILGGDLIDGGVPVEELSETRRRIAAILGQIKAAPVLAVLGNHESWTDPAAWKLELNNSGVNVIDGRVLSFGSLGLCVRGLGDVYSGKFRYVEFPEHCAEMTRISITHDPAGAFKPGVEGLVLAGHTHCGQVRLPLIGAPWVPSDAPPEAHCGLYKDSIRSVFVSSGVGTSLLPFRLGAQSQWDLISLAR